MKAKLKDKKRARKFPWCDLGKASKLAVCLITLFFIKSLCFTSEYGLANVVNHKSDEQTAPSNSLLPEEPPNLLVPKKFEVNKDSNGKYFVYQPSGGWGNQRIILQNAIAAANAMERTLVLPPIAPHNFLYYGYNKIQGHEMLPMSALLDIPRLESVVKKGILIWNDTLANLEEFWSDKSWKTYSKPRYLTLEDKKNKHMWHLDASYISRKWNKVIVPEDVVFWDKDGMWLCCGPSQIYSSSIGLSHRIRSLSFYLSQRLTHYFHRSHGDYNAIHIRRSGGHTGKDRRTAIGFYKEHGLARFNKTDVLYIATDETRKNWFLPFVTELGFKNVMFFEDLDQEVIQKELAFYPEAMRGDVTGFIEQMVCTYAKDFEGSHASTFSVAIKIFRRNPGLKSLRIRE